MRTAASGITGALATEMAVQAAQEYKEIGVKAAKQAAAAEQTFIDAHGHSVWAVPMSHLARPPPPPPPPQEPSLPSKRERPLPHDKTDDSLKGEVQDLLQADTRKRKLDEMVTEAKESIKKEDAEKEALKETKGEEGKDKKKEAPEKGKANKGGTRSRAIRKFNQEEKRWADLKEELKDCLQT